MPVLPEPVGDAMTIDWLLPSASGSVESCTEFQYLQNRSSISYEELEIDVVREGGIDVPNVSKNRLEGGW